MSELENLKQLADNKGIQYHPNIGLDSLKKKIEEYDAQFEAPAIKTNMSKASKRESLRKEAHKLIRVTVNCMDPKQRHKKGEFLSVGNSVLGFYTKFVAFDTEYHLPKMAVDVLREAEYRTSVEKTDAVSGKKYRKNVKHKAFNIVELAPLTKEELKELARQQAIRGGLDD